MARTNTTPVLHHNNPLFTLITKPSHSLLFSKASFLHSNSLNSLSSSNLHFRAPIARVSTAPVNYASPSPPDFDFQKEITRLRGLRERLGGCRSLDERMELVDSDVRVRSFFNSKRNGFGGGLSVHEMYLMKCVVAAGQEHVLVSDCGGEVNGRGSGLGRSSIKSALYALAEMIEKWDKEDGGGESEGVREEKEAMRSLFKMLGEVERFYDCIGGIIGYQEKVLELLVQSTLDSKTTSWSQQPNKLLRSPLVEIHPPSVVDLSKDAEYAFQAALWGIEGLPDLGEIYPLGGSADRLDLVDSRTGECLPAAMLPFLGRTLLEGLLRDLQAREFLYFKLYGEQCITPVAIMTSSAKSNHAHITRLCERLGWFGRGKSRFLLFEQPLVPAVAAEDGQWVVSRPFVPVCKPGGHGVIWKLAHDKGVFQWFQSHGRKGATVRQISNVVAATDLTLLALAGLGLHHGKKLGFASCARTTGATEGINVLVEKKNIDGNWAYGFSCIEYTEFDKFGITAGLLSPESLQEKFPANTNILYVDLPSAEIIGSSKNETSLPGMVLNVKKPISYTDQFGMKHRVPGGRLECTMQNVADNFANTYSSRCHEGLEDSLDTFIVYNERRKVTSSAKKSRKHADKSMAQTPDGALLDITRNAYDLLSCCGITIPKVEGNDEYINSGPPFLILLHPALGPLWTITRQKFCGGSIARGSELQLEVAELFWRDVELDGSLIVLADNAMGSTTTNGIGEPILEYGRRCSRCKLENVKVLNEGIDWKSGNNLYWKHDVQRAQVLKVILHGNAEFEAKDVLIEGDHVFDVPDGHKMRITSGISGLDIQLMPIQQELMDTGSWFWKYKFSGADIHLELIELMPFPWGYLASSCCSHSPEDKSLIAGALGQFEFLDRWNTKVILSCRSKGLAANMPWTKPIYDSIIN